MAIIGITFTKMFAQRNKTPKGDLKINHSLNITDIKNQETKIEKGKTLVDFIFEFKADYNPNVAEMLVNGKIHCLEEDKKAQEIVKGWEKNKHVEPSIMTGVINMAFHKSLLKALEMSETINVPPVVPLPIVSPKKNKAEDYIG
jgi:hypothetical protein